MKRLVAGIVVCCAIVAPFVMDSSLITVRTATEIRSPAPGPDAPGQVETNAFRSGRRTYRAPARGGNTGVQAPGATRTGQRPVSSTPVTRAPASRWGGFGGFFGGLFAGSLLGSLFNPFGYGGLGFGGFNLLAVLIWVGLFYVAFRFIRRMLAPRR
ncbi:hypothetical protein [Cohnella panacarvi]|uniref:hypothetical protein n=1 Tax=Cohnella panacarvi TaxID=400776 RepID=UPI000478AFF5|nr:hypothetical protein [Cohnella panacarvi]